MKANAADSTALAVVSVLNPVVVFSDGGVDDVLDKVRKEAAQMADGLDISTTAGRAAIASVAYKVARSKTALDEMGKTLAAELRSKVSAIDADRKRIRDSLDQLKDEVRAPLTQWETAEELRTGAHNAVITEMEQLGVILGDVPATELRQRLEKLALLSVREWQEFKHRAQHVAGMVAEGLKAAITRAEKREAEAIEAEKARIAEAARVQAERDAKIAAEAADKAKREAEAKAKEAARIAAQKAQEAIEREKERVRKAKADAEAAKAKAEADTKAAVEAERQRVAAIAAKEQAAAEKREANKRHRAKIHLQAISALIGTGITKDQAVAVVEAIAAETIPNVKIEY